MNIKELKEWDIYSTEKWLVQPHSEWISVYPYYPCNDKKAMYGCGFLHSGDLLSMLKDVGIVRIYEFPIEYSYQIWSEVVM